MPGLSLLLLVSAAAVQAQPPAVQSTAPGIAVTNTAPPQVVLPPHSVPPAAMQPPSAVADPQPRMPVARYITPLDYPAAANGAQGTVGFQLTIDPGGRVIGCAVTRSSGSRVLDEATCRLLQRRARYTPARDSNGNPGVGTVEDEVVWKLPGR